MKSNLEPVCARRIAGVPQRRRTRSVVANARLVLSSIMVCCLTWQLAESQSLAPQTARDLLRLHGIDASQLDRFQDGEPLGAMDEETLIRILQRMPRFPRNALERWSHPAPKDWTDILAAPSEHRMAIFRLSGRAIQVEKSALIPEMASRLEFKEYFRVTIQMPESKQVAVICTRNVPQAWLDGAALNEPVGATALFLKTGRQGTDLSELVFVAERVAWFPEREQTSRKVTSAQVYLAQLGLDVGLLDDVRMENKKPLGLADRECFYQLLTAIQHAARTDFINRSQQSSEVVPLLREPQSHHGQLFVLEGIARRAIKIRVDDADVRERFGIEHYYQIDLFVDLDKQVVKIGKGQAGRDAAIFENSYPVTVCVPSLPSDLTESDVLRENVRVHAAFFKLWSYSSDYVSSVNKNLLQISPMFIGIEPRVVKAETYHFGMGYVLAAVTVVLIIGIWFGLRQQRSRAVSSTNKLPGLGTATGGSSDDEIVLPERPDFTNLN